MKHIINYLIISLCILFSLNTFGQSNGEEYNYTKNDLTQFIRESILHYLRQPSNIDDNNIFVCIDNIPSEIELEKFSQIKFYSSIGVYTKWYRQRENTQKMMDIRSKFSWWHVNCKIYGDLCIVKVNDHTTSHIKNYTYLDTIFYIYKFNHSKTKWELMNDFDWDEIYFSAYPLEYIDIYGPYVSSRIDFDGANIINTDELLGLAVSESLIYFVNQITQSTSINSKSTMAIYVDGVPIPYNTNWWFNTFYNNLYWSEIISKLKSTNAINIEYLPNVEAMLSTKSDNINVDYMIYPQILLSGDILTIIITCKQRGESDSYDNLIALSSFQYRLDQTTGEWQVTDRFFKEENNKSIK